MLIAENLNVLSLVVRQMVKNCKSVARKRWALSGGRIGLQFRMLGACNSNQDKQENDHQDGLWQPAHDLPNHDAHRT